MPAWKRSGGGYYSRPVRVQLSASGLATCAEQAANTPAYTQLRIRTAARPGAALSRRWKDWPLHILRDGNICKPPFEPRPYQRPAANTLQVYYRGDWNWRSLKMCVGPGLHIERAPFGLQYSLRYHPNVHGDIVIYLRNYYARGGTPIPHGTAVPVRIVVADPEGRLASATIAVTRDREARATFPRDFLRGGLLQTPVGHRGVPPGTYTIVLETLDGSQIACSGAFIHKKDIP